jgi:hypothetical protein
MKTMSTNEMVAELESKGYIIEKSITGYFRLTDLYDNIIHDDSACEDVYEYDSAVALFYGISKEVKYDFRVINPNRDGSYDLEFSKEFENLEDAYNFYYDFKNYGIGSEKELVDLYNNKNIEQTY